MPVIIVGGIVGGVFTPTEAAAVAVLYGLLVAMLVYRELALRDLPRLVLRASALSAAVMTIIGTASIFGWLVASANVPAALAEWIRSVSSEPWTYLLMINVVLMAVGMFMESLAAILILVPVLMPIAIDFGIDPVHFGLVVVMNFAIGMVTPPYGITLFVASSVAERNIVQVSRRMFWPWLMMTLILVPGHLRPGHPAASPAHVRPALSAPGGAPAGPRPPPAWYSIAYPMPAWDGTAVSPARHPPERSGGAAPDGKGLPGGGAAFRRGDGRPTNSPIRRTADPASSRYSPNQCQTWIIPSSISRVASTPAASHRSASLRESSSSTSSEPTWTRRGGSPERSAWSGDASGVRGSAPAR